MNKNRRFRDTRGRTWIIPNDPREKPVLESTRRLKLFAKIITALGLTAVLAFKALAQSGDPVLLKGIGSAAVATGAGASNTGTLRVALADGQSVSCTNCTAGGGGSGATATTSTSTYITGASGALFVKSTDTVITASVLPTGAATSSKQDTALASLASIDSKLTAPVSVGGTVSSAFNSRADTYTGTANGVTVTPTYPVRTFAIQVKGTGAAATTWDIRIEGSLNGTDFTQILSHTNTTGDGAVLYSATLISPSLYFRSRCSGLVLGGASNVVVTILGVQ